MAWDKDLPIEGALAPTYNNIMRANQAALEAAYDAYFRFATGGTQTGQPRQGSARVYFQDSAPTARLDGDYFDSTDLGCIWIDSNSSPDNQFNILTAADGAGTETWTPISTEVIEVLLASARVFASTLGVTGNFAVNTDKFTVAASSGNTAVAGTLGVTGILTPSGGLADGSALAAATQAADGDLTISDKLYVENNGHPPINGTQTAVKTKYFTGNLDADSETSVAHGVTGGAANIMMVSAAAYNDVSAQWTAPGGRVGTLGGNGAFLVDYDDTNVIFGSVGANLQGNAYRIKVDYK